MLWNAQPVQSRDLVRPGSETQQAGNCQMRQAVSHSDDRIIARFWMEKGDGNPSCRTDSVMLAFDPKQAEIEAITNVDTGLLILQPQRARVTLSERLRNSLLGDELASDLDLVAQALALAVLASSTSFELRICSLQESKAREPDVGMDAFQALLSATGNVANESELPSQNDRKEFIEVPERIAAVGIESGLFRANDDFLRLEDAVEVSFASSVSALDAAKSMERDKVEFDIDLPEGFRAFDLQCAAKALQAVRNPSASSACYFGNRSHPAHEVRMQAAETYPLLAEQFAMISEYSEAIDNKRRLSSVICGNANLQPGQLKRIAKITTPLPSGRIFEPWTPVRGADLVGANRARRHSISGELDLHRFLDIVREMDSGWIPDDEAAWRRFLDIVSGCALPINNLYRTPFPQLLGSAKGNWERFHASLAKSANIAATEFDRSRLGLTTVDALDMIDDFSRTVVLPQILTIISEAGEALPHPTSSDLSDASDVSYRLIVGNSENLVGALYETARKWMSRIPSLIEIDARHRTVESPDARDSDEAWPRLVTEDFTTENGAVVRNLASKSELRTESSRLSHCVGRLYVRSCLAGESHIFSIQTVDGTKSYSTFEVSPPVSGAESVARGQVSIAQHKGHRNRPPPQIALDALDEWLSAVRNGRLELNLDETISWRDRMRRRSDQAPGSDARGGQLNQRRWEGILDFGFSNEELRSATWEEWTERILGRKRIKGSLSDAVLSNAEARNLIRRLSPVAAGRIHKASDKASSN